MEQNPLTDSTPRYNLQIMIKFHKVIFEQDEEIFVRFLIKNQGREPVFLKIADKAFLNFTFLLKNQENQTIVEKNEYYLYKKRNKKNRNYRTIRLTPGDIYGKTFDIRTIFDIDNIGFYTVQGFFYPVPYGFHDINNYPSNVIKFKVQYNAQRLQVARHAALVEEEDAQKIRNPYETIEFILKSKLDGKWDNFFRYIDLTRLIEIYPDFYNRYKTVQFSKRALIIEEFKKFLKTYLEEQMTDFDVYRTIINREDAEVLTNIIYKYRGSKFKRRYVFRLYRRGNRWYLYNFYVMNLKLTRQYFSEEQRQQAEKRERQREEQRSAIPRYD